MATTTGGLAHHPARRPTLAQIDQVWANLVEPVADADDLNEHLALVR